MVAVDYVLSTLVFDDISNLQRIINAEVRDPRK